MFLSHFVCKHEDLQIKTVVVTKRNIWNKIKLTPLNLLGLKLENCLESYYLL